MKTHRWMIGWVAAGCAVGMTLPYRATAEVSDADFNALKDSVQKLGQQVQGLEQSNQVQQQIHEQDVQQIQQLQQKLTETQQVATNAELKSIEASQTQPLPRQPLDEATVNHSFMMLGDAEFQFVKAENQNAAFVLADFAPIFLYRAGDNILFEAGFDAVLQNDSNGATPPHDSGSSTSFGLSFAQIDYVMNNYVTFEAGQLLLPLGTYSERSAGWLNKIPDDPLVVGLIPGSGVGVELQGAVAMGDAGQFVNYQVYGVNGPSSSDGTGDPTQLDLGGNVGLKSDNTVANLHGNPSGGGRLGYFIPFPKPHYDLELGVSGQAGEWDDAGQYLWSANVYDAALHLGPNFEAKGEYVMTWYGSTAGTINQKGWYAQVGYKLAGLDSELPLINNTELVGRYDYVNDGLGAKTKRYTAGFIYYITNTLLFEGDYEFLNSTDPAQNDADQLILQLSLGF